MKDKGSARSRDATIGGWGPIVFSASFFAYFISGGLYYNVGIYFVLFLEAFNESRSYTSWIGALLSCMFHAAGPISSLLLPLIGPRGVVVAGGLCLAISFALTFPANSVVHAMLFFGLFGGMGNLFTMSGCLAASGVYFKKRLYLANGIIGAGGGLGTIILGILAEYLTQFYGWRGSLLILSGMALQICIAGVLLFDKARKPPRPRVRPDDQETATTQEETTFTSNVRTDRKYTIAPSPSKFHYFRDARFWGVTLSTMLMNFTGFSLMLFLKDIALQRIPNLDYKEVVIWLGAGSVLGRGTSGLIATRLNPFLYYFSVGLVCAIDVYFFSMANVAWAFHGLGFVFGFCHGTFCVLQSIQIVHVYGREEMAVIWGYTMMLSSAGVLIGPPLGGLIADVTQSYHGTLILYSAGILFSGLLSLFVYIVQRQKENGHPGNAILVESKPCLDPGT